MNPSDIAGEIIKNKKYSGIDPALVERISAEAITKYSKAKDVVKAVKKELHIISESFLPEGGCAKAKALIEAYTGNTMASDKRFALELMPLHASTKERLPWVEDIYSFLSGYIGEDVCVFDIGCGFNPFGIPLLREKPRDYIAYDISIPIIYLLSGYFERSGLPYRAEVLDAAVHTPGINGDICLMFKLFPLLERQKKGRGFELLMASGCPVGIVSFPLKSASGKEKGMEAFYSSYFEGGLPEGFVVADKIVLENEMFYVVKR